MKTRRPFSSVSYNTVDWFVAVMRSWLDAGKLVFVSFIVHQPEEDENRVHIHWYAQPDQTIDTKDLLFDFTEPDPDGPLDSDGNPMPRRCLPCRSSHWDDWYLYSMHHKEYLAMKHQSRKFQYLPEDFHHSSPELAHEMIARIDWSKINPMGQVIRAAKSGQRFEDFIEHNNLPMVQFQSAQKIYAWFCDGVTERNGRLGHEEDWYEYLEERDLSAPL